MAISSSRSNISYHVRSTSFPSTSYPTTFRVESQLNKFQTSATSSADEICINLSSLEDLYKSMDELLGSPQTQKALREKRVVDELMDESVRILDVCGSIRDLVTQMKDNLIDLHSALRRRKGDSSMESSIAKYTSFQKKMNNESKRLISSLKQMETKSDDVDHQMIKALREVSTVAKSIFKSILAFVCVPVSKSNRSKWSLVSKLINKGEVACEIQLENVQGLESRIEEIENGLEGVFRRMVKTRTSLLNNISSYY